SAQISKDDFFKAFLVFRDDNVSDAAQLQVFELQYIHQDRTRIRTADVTQDKVGEDRCLLLGSGGNPKQLVFELRDLADGEDVWVVGLEMLVDLDSPTAVDAAFLSDLDIWLRADRIDDGIGLDDLAA